MTRANRFAKPFLQAAAFSLTLGACLVAQAQSAANLPITSGQRATAQQVAAAGVPLSELSPNAPDSYTVKKGDTLWDISSLYLVSPWRWPELWGMNMDEIRNPHLIYPGQVLFLEKTGDRARLRVGQEVGTSGPSGDGRLSPRVRSSEFGRDGIPTIPVEKIEPFLNQAIVLNSNELAAAPRVVAAPENRVLMTTGDLAYVRGDLGTNRNFRVFREAVPLYDPTTKQLLGYEGRYLGTAELTRRSSTASGSGDIVPDTFTISSIKEEIRAGDRLSPVPPREFINYVPHAPQGAIAGQIISIYGDAVNAGQHQVVAINKGLRDGLEIGHVLALWRDGQQVLDKTNNSRSWIKLPNERHGHLLVFRVFDRVSYALILNVQNTVSRGDRFTQP
jgi:LysM repeat protein